MGHAVEVRIYAEDPSRNFAPSPGKISRLRLPEGPGVRNDCGVVEGGRVEIHYDPMLAKLIVWGEDRPRALRRLRRALAEMRVEGIATTVPLFRELLDDPEFVAAEFDIGWLDRKIEAGELGIVDGACADEVLIGAVLEHVGRLHGEAANGEAVAWGTGLRRHWGKAARRDALRRVYEVHS